MRKGFVVRERSLSNLPSKQLFKTSSEFKNQPLMINQVLNKAQQSNDYIKLKTNYNMAMEIAANEAVASSRAKEETMRSTQTKIHMEKKYNTISTQLFEEKDKLMKAQANIANLEYKLEKEEGQNKKLRERLTKSQKDNFSLKEQLKEMQILRRKVDEMELLKNRIVLLENQLRMEKLTLEEMNKEKLIFNKTIEILKHTIQQVKPEKQQLQQRIYYLERVNLQLERKMEDFHKRDFEYRKEIEHWKTSHTKMTADRNKFRTNYENTYATLQEKLKYITQLQAQIQDKKNQIEDLTKKLQDKTKQCEDLKNQLQSTIDYYKSIMDENAYLKKRNQVLQQFEDENRRTLASHIRVAEETNLYIIERNSSISKVEKQNQELKKLLDKVEEKFTKLDKIFEDGSMRGQSEIIQSYYTVIRQSDKLALQIKQTKEELEEKVLNFGEQRDFLQRKIDLYQPPIPDEEHLYEALIADKTEEIVMLESSNDQLLKIKRQLQERVQNLENDNEETKKEIHSLRIKAAELFKIKKNLEQANSKISRYQEMIEENRQTIADLHSQAEILRGKIAQLSDKNFKFDLDNRNMSFKIQQMENIMKELDIQYLNAKKTQNEKNAHVLVDSMEKIQNGINSISFYFSCCFCSQFPQNPVTLANCGHIFCTNCKDAYAEYCYECDTGQPIQKVFMSKFLKQTISKYKFLLMVVKEARNNLITIQL